MSTIFREPSIKRNRRMCMHRTTGCSSVLQLNHKPLNNFTHLLQPNCTYCGRPVVAAWSDFPATETVASSTKHSDPTLCLTDWTNSSAWSQATLKNSHLCLKFLRDASVATVFWPPEISLPSSTSEAAATNSLYALLKADAPSK